MRINILRWANKNNYEVKELDYLEGNEAGIKSVTFEIIEEKCQIDHFLLYSKNWRFLRI